MSCGQMQRYFLKQSDNSAEGQVIWRGAPQLNKGQSICPDLIDKLLELVKYRLLQVGVQKLSKPQLNSA